MDWNEGPRSPPDARNKGGVQELFIAQRSPVLNDPFIVRPYIQLGDSPSLRDPESMILMWHARDVDLDWKGRSRERPIKVGCLLRE